MNYTRRKNELCGTIVLNRLMIQIIKNELDKQTRYGEIQLLCNLKSDFIVVFDSIYEMAYLKVKI